MCRKNSTFETTFQSQFGTLKIIWQEKGKRPKVHEVLLPNETALIANPENIKIPQRSSHAITDLIKRLQRFLEGKNINFDLKVLNFNQCTEFQKRVLLAEYGIPRGWLSTYGRIAKHLGVPGGARAVGNALATNPFPIIIPCHRAIRSNGELGGYRGGIEMKRKLLEMEGIEFSASGRVVTDRIYY